MPEPLAIEDFRTLSQYEFAGQGAWTTMPETDKDVYRKIHARLDQILEETFSKISDSADFDSCTTLGFNINSGVRGNRPKDLWCAVFPRGGEAYMPQVYLIVSPRGIELGYAAAIHHRDFSDPAFKAKLRELAPRVFDALPSPDGETAESISNALTEEGYWYFRRKARLPPKESDFSRLEDLLTFLKSQEGKVWGAGNIARYWLPQEVTAGLDLTQDFLAALNLFKPLMVHAKPAQRGQTPTHPDPEPEGEIRASIERFMAIYPDRRSRPFGTDEELWNVFKKMQERFYALPALTKRPTVRINWSVGQGNWARVPWIAFLDARVTETTQRGIYVVVLFREDMSGAYITFNQGVTEPKKEHGASSGLQLLRERAADLRGQCGELAQRGFKLDAEIDLRTEGVLGHDYEAATIAYKLYERDQVPQDGEIADDLEALLIAYDRVIASRQGPDAAEPEPEPRPIPPSPPYHMEDALSDLFLDENEIRLLIDLWRSKKNLLLQGAPGVGKTFVARRLSYLLIGHIDRARTRMVQFHQAYAYEDFMQGYRPSEAGGFTRRDGAFFDFAKLAEADLDRPYVFIIDEINRGNLSKIMGELMMLIEPDKRGEDYALPLAYARPDEPPFSVPPNLFLLGLMNTADRSLAIVDYALRRRFAFHTLSPRYENEKFRNLLKRRGASDELIAIIVARMHALNAEISADRARLGPGYQIGHSFFVPSDVAQALDLAWYRRVITSEIGPLLDEYCFDNPGQADDWKAMLLEGVG